jgi:beta-lactamase class D
VTKSPALSVVSALSTYILHTYAGFAVALVVVIGVGAQAAGAQSCVMINETGTPQRLLGTATDCATPLSPASTYKIPHALIGLETGVVTSTTVVKWDGVRHPDQPKWNQDHTVFSAMRPSVLWFFQDMAPRIGATRAREWLQKFHYGNTDTSGPITQYWLNGRLRISPAEQLAFVTKFYEDALPVSKTHAAQLRSAMQEDPGTVENARGVHQLDAAWRADISLNAKTGATTTESGESVSWLVGKLTVDRRQIPFVSAVWRSRASVDSMEATRVAIKAFVERGILDR